MAHRAERPPAILLGGEAIALSVARSLAKEGVTVLALGHDVDPIRRSRACSEFISVGKGTALQVGTLHWLEHEGPHAGVIIPCDDEPLELVARNRALIESWGYSVTESTDAGILAMLDKITTYEIAIRAGIPTPRWAELPTPAAALDLAAEVGFPCAIKPAVSHEWARRFPLHTKALTAADTGELEAAIGAVAGMDSKLMLTELVPGGDDAYWSYYAYREPGGQRMGEATKHKLRQFPPGFGQSTLNVLEWDEEVAEAGWRFIEAAELVGIAYVEFKRDPRDGELRLIECNHRAVGPRRLFAEAGCDLALLSYRRAIGEEPEPLGRPDHNGSGLIRPLLDLRSALASRRAGETTMRAWARSLMRRLYLPVFALSDPMPSLAALGIRIRRRLRFRAGAAG